MVRDDLQEILSWLNEMDRKDIRGSLTYDKLIAEIRGMIFEVELMIEEDKQ